ncbi:MULTISPECIES: ABC transporter permease [Actinomyces]|uniref:Transport permease protein n=1 Tax=Actinomyces respiraculi TaxID=2744574 RepID=A0A7T0LL84_9ACTO|nr:MULTISPECIES: ABC transporter permease [Actinomyces]QPL05821.1 ABC transporter permease [Actinomyces respiraculi]
MADRLVDPDESPRRVLDLTLRLTQRSVSSEFKGTALGRLWSLINPLATIAVFALIFGVVFRGGVEPGRNSGIDSFALWIGIGVICWNFLSSGVMNAMNALVSNSGLLTKVYFPRQVLVYSAVAALVVDFLFEMVVLLLITVVVGGPKVLLMVPALVVVTALTALFSIGLGMILSIATVYFRDISHLWQIFNQVWMYASGVVFSLTMLDDVQNRLFDMGWSINGRPIPVTTIFRLNPAETFLEAFRSCLYDYALPSPWVSLACLLWGVGTYAVGITFFKRHSARIVEEL